MQLLAIALMSIFTISVAWGQSSTNSRSSLLADVMFFRHGRFVPKAEIHSVVSQVVD